MIAIDSFSQFHNCRRYMRTVIILIIGGENFYLLNFAEYGYSLVRHVRMVYTILQKVYIQIPYIVCKHATHPLAIHFILIP